MSSLVITYNKKKLNFPTRLNELTQEQFLFVASHFSDGFKRNEEELEDLDLFRIKLLKMFTGLSLFKFADLTKEEVADMLPYVDFVFGDFDLDICLFRKFRHKGRTYYGPDEQFESFTFKELGDADECFIQYIKTNDRKWLLKLTAILYRTKKSFPYNRRNYKESELDKNCKKLSAIDSKFLAGSLYTWWAFRENVMMKIFPQVFEKPTGTNVAQTKNNYGWAGTITASAGLELGTVTQAEETNWMTAFTFMSMQIDKLKNN